MITNRGTSVNKLSTSRTNGCQPDQALRKANPPTPSDTAVRSQRTCPKGNVHRVQFTSGYYVFLDGFDRPWLAVSKSFANLLGWSPDRLVGVTAPELMPKGDRIL
jgi:hypothetical protein